MNGSPARVLPAVLGLALAAGLLVLSCSHAAKRQEPRSAVPQSPPGDPVVSFETVRIVLQSPRCVNCHPVGDAPLQGDDSHVHLQNIQRGSEGRGIPGLNCAACHGKANPPESYGPNAPPGVSTDWHLPPADMKMVFEGLGGRALCEQLKDPQRNGGKDLASMLEHVAHDPLVLWGWSPGHGRNPVPIAHAEFVAAFKTWADHGGPCPER